MSIEDLKSKYFEMCGSHDDCGSCEYDQTDCQLNFFYNQGKTDAIEEVYKNAEEKMKEQIEYLNRSPQRNGKMWARYMVTYLSHIKTACEQLKEKK